MPEASKLSLLSFHRILEGLKWAAFLATLGLLYVQVSGDGLPMHYG